MPGVLIDTDVAIDFLRGVTYAQPLLVDLWSNGPVAISVLTVFELTAGMRNTEKVVTYSFIEACEVELVTPEIALRGGDLFRKYRAKGVTLTSLDCLIAATAMVKGYKVATRNVKHYPENGILLDI